MRRSTTAVQPAVNRKIGGSNPPASVNLERSRVDYPERSRVDYPERSRVDYPERSRGIIPSEVEGWLCIMQEVFLDTTYSWLGTSESYCLSR